jgi:hypothetical protein
MEGSVLSFLEAEWKASDTGWASSLQVNPIVGHLNFLLYDWKREVNHSLIKTPRKNSTLRCRILIFFGVKKKFIPNIYIHVFPIRTKFGNLGSPQYITWILFYSELPIWAGISFFNILYTFLCIHVYIYWE